MDTASNYDHLKGADLIRVLVADSNRIYTQLLAEALQRDSHLNVVAAPQPADMEKSQRRAHADVAVVSSNFGGSAARGLDLLRQMHQISPQLRSVVLLDACDREATVNAFRAGARGVFSREDSLDTLCECVRQVHAGKIWASPQQMSYAVEALAAAPNIRAVDASGVDLLSKREIEVVRGVADGLTNREIAERLELSPHTIKNYLFRTFEKLGVSNRMELLSFALAVRTPESAKAKPDAQTQIGSGRYLDGSYELQMAETYAEGRGVERNTLIAYMWCLVAEHCSEAIRERVEAGKRRLAESLTTEQILEAHRAAKDKMSEYAPHIHPKRAAAQHAFFQPEVPLTR